jgi:hypothetical protein
MRPHSPILASLANVFRIPITRPQVTPSTSTILQTLSARNSQQTSSFSTTPSLAKRKSVYKPDKRISTSTPLNSFHHPQSLNWYDSNILNSINKILPLPPPHPTPPPLLTQPLPPPLDHPPRLATLPIQITHSTRDRTLPPTTSHVRCMRRIAH